MPCSRRRSRRRSDARRERHGAARCGRRRPAGRRGVRRCGRCGGGAAGGVPVRRLDAARRPHAARLAGVLGACGLGAPARLLRRRAPGAARRPALELPGGQRVAARPRPGAGAERASAHRRRPVRGAPARLLRRSAPVRPALPGHGRRRAHRVALSRLDLAARAGAVGDRPARRRRRDGPPHPDPAGARGRPRTLFLVTGAAKAPALARIRGGEPLPAGMVQGAEWFVDVAAVSAT